MMMHTIFLWLALAVTAHAGQLLWPQGSLTTTQALAVLNVLYCTRLPAEQSMTATAIYGYVSDGNTSTCSWAVYADSDSGALLASATAACANNPTSTLIGATGLSVVFTRGTIYRLCACGSVANTAWFAPTVLATSSTDRVHELMNSVAGHAVHGTAANPCTAPAVPPATTGALTASNNFSTGTPALLLVE